MLKENIDRFILEAMKSHDEKRVATLRLIKTKFMEFSTAKNAKPLDATAEIGILKKMASERKESISIYSENNRQDLVEKEQSELEVIEEFLPAEVTEEQIRECINEIANSGLTLEKKNMGLFMKQINVKYPMVDGKIASSMLNSMF